MRCPHCGSPVRIYGSRWECGWCGDFGALRLAPALQETMVSCSVSYHVDLSEIWTKMKEDLAAITSKHSELLALLGKVLLHTISYGIHHAKAFPDEQKIGELRAFLNDTHDLHLDESNEAILCAAKHEILFCKEAALSRTDCGAFWSQLISARPAEEYYHREGPDGLYDLLSELSAAYAYFGGERDREMGEAQDRQSALLEAYRIHWQDKVLLHPDIERAKQLLSEGKFPDCEDICREILLIEYPEEVPHESAEEYDDQSWQDILNSVFADDTARGVEMWRALLDIAEPALKNDPDTAKRLLPDWEWLELSDEEQVRPLLTALKDERFALQIFQSASIGGLQMNILNACRDSGQEKLGRHCLTLALKNPYLAEVWEQRLKQVIFPAPEHKKAEKRKSPVDSAQDDGTVFHYCTVRIQGVPRPYSYLTGGLPLRVGDWVEVPFGRDNAPACGQVSAITDHTRRTAPWPPEQTKSVLRVCGKPVTIVP